MIRETDADDAVLTAYVAPSATSLALTNNDVNYVYYTLSLGAISWNVTTDATLFDGITKVIAFIVSRDGTQLNIVNLAKINVDGNRKNRRQKFESDGRTHRGAYGSYLGTPSMANAGTLNLTVSQGRCFVMDTPISHGAFDTTIAGAGLANNFSRFTNRSAYVKTNGIKTINNTQYDLAGTLTTMPNNHWRRDDWYVVLCNTNYYLAKVMGNNEFATEAGAVSSGPPATLPSWFDGQGISMYLGYSTIQKNAATATFYDFRGSSTGVSTG